MNKSLQDQFFEIVLSKFAKRSQAVEAIGGLLGVGKDAVYRRFRGDTLLTPDELSMLAKKFDVSLDAIIFGEANNVVFTYNHFPQTVQKFGDYLTAVYKNVKDIYQTQSASFYYATAELPIFHYCHFPEIISFKLYVWARTVWDIENVDTSKFSFDTVPFIELEIIDDLLRLYHEIPSTELWHLNIMDNTLNQIEYHVSSGGFRDSKDALVLCDKLEELANYIQLMAQHGRKFAVGSNPEDVAEVSFDLYHNEMVYTNNTILAITPHGRTIYATYGSPNFLKTTNERMCDYTEDWFKKIIGKSISISTYEEKSRVWFFNNLKRKIKNVRNRIESRMEEY